MEVIFHTYGRYLLRSKNDLRIYLIHFPNLADEETDPLK